MAETKWINQNGGNWNDAANWDNGVPDSTKSAVINAASFAANGKTIIINATANMLNFDCSAAAYTFTLSNAAYAFNVYGDLKDSTKRISGFSSTGYLYFKGSSNIYSNGATQGWNRIYLDGVGATFTNQDDWNVGNTSYYHVNGLWNTNNYIITTNSVYTVLVGVKTIDLGSSIFNCGYWSIDNPSGFTLVYGTSHIIQSGPLNFYDATGRTYYDVTFNSPSFSQMNGGPCTFHNLTRNTALLSGGLVISSSHLVLNILTITGLNAQNYRLLVASNVIGTPRTITVNGSIVASNVDFRDITLAGTANRDLSAISGGSGDCGGNSGITFTPSQTQYYKHTSGACNWSDATKWVTSSGGSTQGRVPLPQDDPIFDENSFTGASTLSVNCPRIGRSLNMEAVNQSVTFNFSNNIECYGSYVLGNNILTYNLYGSYLWLMSNSSSVINTYNQIHYTISFEGKGTYLNKSNLNISYYLRVQNTGTFDLNDYDATIAFMYIPSGYLYLGNGLITLTCLNNNYAILGVGTIYPEGSTIKLNASNASSNMVFNSNRAYNKVIFSGNNTGNYVIIGNNTFNELIIEKGRKVQITGGTTQIISPTGKFIADGAPAEQITIGSTNTTPFNLAYAGTGYHQVNYCNISYCNATANKFYAGKNSVDGGNNTGWLFRNYLKKQVRIFQRLIKI